MNVHIIYYNMKYGINKWHIISRFAMLFSVMTQLWFAVYQLREEGEKKDAKKSKTLIIKKSALKQTMTLQ